ncbi:putative quinol monooxygenase [Actinomyces culturomici]|uniref:putative quinol monooxygenase n=1 Tax=Actinomyces culturomici TaxID=1926276 RepID=UPI000E206C60|nr:putative quinol monooxygenase [Actinomyces culturomici]
MKILIARFTAKDGYADEVAEMIAGLARDVHTEPGNVAFEPHREVDNPNAFVVFEKYRDEDAFQAHLAMPYGAVFNARLNEIIEEPESQLTFLDAVE